MSSTLNFEPPEGTPLGDCLVQVDDLRKKKNALKQALRNLLVIEEYKKIRGEDEKYLKLQPKLLAQARSTLNIAGGTK